MLRRMLALCLVASVLSLTELSTSAEPPYLVKDINTAPSVGLSSDATEFVAVGGVTFFTACDSTAGCELWKTDGTTDGTTLVKDIWPGFRTDPRPQRHHIHLTDLDGQLMFHAEDGVTGLELWKSDGTAQGTVLVKDIYPGPGDSIHRYSDDLYMVSSNGRVFFSADDGTNGRELWMSDGTEAGTVLVKDILPGPLGGGANSLTDVDGTVFFVAYDPDHGRELWKSDGTASGTVLVKDIMPGEYSGVQIGTLIALNGALFFIGDDGVNRARLWKSDGTEAGTMMIATSPLGIDELVIFDGNLYLTTGCTLYKMDPLTDVIDIVAATHCGSQNLTPVGNKLFFEAGNTDLWVSDGTEAGTAGLKHFNLASDLDTIGALDGKAYFSAESGL